MFVSSPSLRVSVTDPASERVSLASQAFISGKLRGDGGEVLESLVPAENKPVVLPTLPNPNVSGRVEQTTKQALLSFNISPSFYIVLSTRLLLCRVIMSHTSR